MAELLSEVYMFPYQTKLSQAVTVSVTEYEVVKARFKIKVLTGKKTFRKTN